MKIYFEFCFKTFITFKASFGEDNRINFRIITVTLKNKKKRKRIIYYSTHFHNVDCGKKSRIKKISFFFVSKFESVFLQG